jgi:Rieske Fe-S protein
VNWDAGSQCFYCPCHGGIFDREGVPMAGPPPEPLYRYTTRVRDGVLEIDARSVPPMA